MFDERGFIARVESANVNELAEIALRPTRDEEQALRVHLGDNRYERLHNLAVKCSFVRGARGTKGNVVAIHGIMGAELSTFNRKGAGDQIWAKVLRLANGWLDRLRLSEDGKTDFDEQFDIRATGIMKRYYGELLLSLARNWNVRAFWFDWRKDLNLAAESLNTHINNWFPNNAPIHIVAHSMGGLVARTFIGRFPERWKAMRITGSNGTAGGRLVMLGTPNHGSLAIPQVMTGLEGLVRKLALVDLRHSLADLHEVLNSFVGSYQMLPSPLAMQNMEPLYRAQTYGDDFTILQRHLDNARRHHEWMKDIVDPDRMIYIAGYNQPTFSNITDFSNLRSLDSYEVTNDGDGRVPHKLGFLKTRDGQNVENYFVEEDHGNLTTNEVVFDALDDLLQTGATTFLTNRLPFRRAIRDGLKGRAAISASESAAEAKLLSLMPSLRIRSTNPIYLASDEREAEEILTRGFLGHKEGTVTNGAGSATNRDTERVRLGTARVEIRLVQDAIENIDGLANDRFVDAISVGHYLGVKPQYAERAIDEAISQALPANRGLKQLSDADLILTQYTERGTLRGELGQVFFLNDPRTSKSKSERIVAIAGMGVPARFGEPELVVLARELCWSLGIMGKHHLATVLIGCGHGNLSTQQAVSAWIRGIKNALSGSVDKESRYLRRITFVEKDPGKIADIQRAILDAKKGLEAENRLKVDYEPFSEQELRSFGTRALRIRLNRMKQELKSQPNKPTEEIATRITVELDGKTYRYGAITKDASIPMREVPLDPSLVMAANQELAAERDPDLQIDRGRFMEKLLLPEDLRQSLHGNMPVVMMLDATTARIHWEMVALSEQGRLSDSAEFLGLGRGFTRQLRTTFAPPPEPPPPSRRVLRVLVVADPAEDAPLVGAQQEGFEVAELFESFNDIYKNQPNTIEVKRMIGPRQAKRTDVLRELINHSYDVLHFAGHCMFDAEDPESSGWIFTDGERLTAKELNRIDRIPKFVFSNACESGITPDRSEKRSVHLAPSFAESFFRRGVADFVCTAWPVEDVPARLFALRLYAGLLGLSEASSEMNSSDSGTQGLHFARGPFQSMHEAMRAARETIGVLGGLTWGAYQHYGNPYFGFFDRITMERDRKETERDRKETKTRTAKARAASQKGRKRKSASKKRPQG